MLVNARFEVFVAKERANIVDVTKSTNYDLARQRLVHRDVRGTYASSTELVQRLKLVVLAQFFHVNLSRWFPLLAQAYKPLQSPLNAVVRSVLRKEHGYEILLNVVEGDLFCDLFVAEAAPCIREDDADDVSFAMLNRQRFRQGQD